MNPLEQLLQCGQSVWLDSISRDLIKSGQLQRLVTGDKLHGLTSNPTIFEQAIGHSDAYDDALRQLLRANEKQTEKTLFEALAIEDIAWPQMCCDPYMMKLMVETDMSAWRYHPTWHVIPEAVLQKPSAYGKRWSGPIS